mgnify:FL=1
MISAFQTTDEILTSYLSEVLNNSAQPLFFSLMQTPCICAHREHYGSQLQGVAVFHDEELLEIGKVSHPRRKTEKMVGKMLVKELLARKLKSPKLKTGSVRVLADSHPVRILSELSEINTAESINSTHASISHKIGRAHV